MTSLRLAAALLIVGAASAPARLAAQTDPRLVAAVRLAQDGLSDSARAVAGRILAATPTSDSLYPEVLFTAGLLAATEQDRRLYLRKVVVDYALSVWADDALLHLGQLDYTTANPEAAARQFDQLIREYPASPLVAQAGYWGARAAGDRRDAAAACRMANAGLAVVADDVELRNLLEFQKQRCEGLGARLADSARAAMADSLKRAQADSVARASASAGSAANRPLTRGFYVQVSAVKTQSAANTEAARIKRAGYTPVIAREAGYMKIRAGAFRTRAEAQTAAADIRVENSVGPPSWFRYRERHALRKHPVARPVPGDQVAPPRLDPVPDGGFLRDVFR